MLGTQATSRTQSMCPSSVSSTQACWSSLYARSEPLSTGLTKKKWPEPHILTKLSNPALAILFTVTCAGCSGFPRVGCCNEGVMKPGSVAGAQGTALQPMNGVAVEDARALCPAAGEADR